MKNWISGVWVIAMLLAACAFGQDRMPLHLVSSTPLPQLKEGDFDHFAVDLPGHRIFCTAEANGKLLVFDLRTNQLIRTVSDLKLPHSILYRADIKKLFVTDGDLGAINIYDAESYRALGSIPLRPGAGPMAYDPQTKYLYVESGGGDGNLPDSYIDVVDTSSGHKLAETKIGSDDVEALLLEPSTHRLFVDVRGENTIEVRDRQTLKVLAKWPIGGIARKPAKMALDAANHRLFIGTRDPERLLVLDSHSGKALAALPAAPMVDDIAFNPVDKRIYYAGSGFADVFVERDPNHYDRIGQLATAFRAKTAVLVPQLHRYYVAVPRHEQHIAELRVYRVLH